MTIVANTYPCVIGVDTHARTHTSAVLQAVPCSPPRRSRPPGPVSSGPLPRGGAGGRYTGGDTDTLFAIEGIGSCGAQPARGGDRSGYLVAEPVAVAPALRRGAGKSDELDAELIARSVLHLPPAQLRRPRPR